MLTVLPLVSPQVGHKNREDVVPELTLEETIELMKDAFVTAGEVCTVLGAVIEWLLELAMRRARACQRVYRD